MTAVTNKTGQNRVAPKVVTTPSAVVSIDDDERQRPSQVVAWTSQGMIVANQVDGAASAKGSALPGSVIV